MYQEYKDRAAFYVVYIQEAHASDVWQMEINEKQNVVFAAPKSLEERVTVADSCVRNLNIQLPAIVDSFENSTDAAYKAWPDRLYVIGRDGRIVYKSNPGPYGFRPKEVSVVLKSLV